MNTDITTIPDGMKVQNLPTIIKPNGNIGVDYPVNKNGVEVYGTHVTFYESGKLIGCLAYDYNMTPDMIWAKFEDYYPNQRTESTTYIAEDWTAESECN